MHQTAIASLYLLFLFFIKPIFSKSKVNLNSSHQWWTTCQQQIIKLHNMVGVIFQVRIKSDKNAKPETFSPLRAERRCGGSHCENAVERSKSKKYSMSKEKVKSVSTTQTIWKLTLLWALLEIQFSFIYIAPNYINCHLKALKWVILVLTHAEHMSCCFANTSL